MPAALEPLTLTIERLRAHRLPASLVLAYYRHGFRAGETCGTCSALGEIWLHSTASPQPYCHVARGLERWEPSYAACGKWRGK